MSLTQPAVSSSETERKIQDLFYEFFKSYFSGGSVTLDGNPITLPLCEILFNAAAPSSTPSITGVLRPSLHLIFADIRPVSTHEFDGKKLVLSPFTLTLYVRASQPIAGKQDADQLCRFIADAVKQLIETESSQLAEKGIKHLRLLRGPIPLSTTGISTRMITARADIIYRSN